MSGSAKCKHCGRPIVWGTNAVGRNVCVDPGSSPRGEWVLEAINIVDGRVQFLVRRIREDDPPEARHTRHFDTCPHRRRPN